MVPIKPAGYKMLVRQVRQKVKTSSGFFLGSDEELKRQQAGFPIYEILAMGSACYRNRVDGSEFPEGPWCKVGDQVVMEGYAGKKIAPREFESQYEDDAEALKELKEMELAGVNFHLVNDDNVMAVLK